MGNVNEYGDRYIQDRDGDRLIVHEADEDGEQCVAIETGGSERVAVLLREEQREELRELLGGSTRRAEEDEDSNRREVVILRLIEKGVVGAGFASRNSLTMETTAAILMLAAFVTDGIDGLVDLSEIEGFGGKK